MTSLIQRSPEWHEFRQKHIGSSDIACIAGLKPFGKTIHDLWLEKTGRKKPTEGTPAMLRGIELEPEARNAFQRETGIMVMPKVLIHKEYEFCAASLDGISFDEKIIAEFKCPTARATFDLAKEGRIEASYECQIQWQLFVTNAEKVFFAVYHPEWGLAMIEVKPDLKKQKSLLKAAIAFWDMVVNDIEPEKEENKFLEIDTPEFVMAAERWKTARFKLEEAKKVEAMAKEELLNCTDGGNVCGSGLKIQLVESSCVDWDGVKLAFNLDEEKLKPFMKSKAPYFKISLSKD